MDARPLFNKYIIPALEKSKIICKDYLVNWASNLFKETFHSKESVLEKLRMA